MWMGGVNCDSARMYCELAIWLKGFRGVGTVCPWHVIMDNSQYFNIYRQYLDVRRDNVVSVLVGNMGHEESDVSNVAYKEPRGLISASIVGSNAILRWKVQGNQGGETPIDLVRGTVDWAQGVGEFC